MVIENAAKNISLAIITIIFSLIVFHAPISVYFGTVFETADLLIKAWKEVLMICAIAPLLYLVIRLGKFASIFRDPLIILMLAFASIHIFSLAIWNGTLPVLAGLMIDLRYIAFFILVYAFLRLYPDYAKRFIKIIGLVSIIAITFGLLQMYLPKDLLASIGYSQETIAPYTTIDRNDDFVRYQSTFRGPNPFGAYASMVATIAFAALAAGRYGSSARAILLIALVATYISHARSAFLSLIAGLSIVFLVRFKDKMKANMPVIAVLIMIGLSLFLGFRNSDFVSNVFLHEDPEEAGLVNSNDEHLNSLQDGTFRMLNQPFGDGVGSTGSASLFGSDPNIIENQYLFIAHEAGWLGLVLFLAIYLYVLLLLWRKRNQPLALGVFAAGCGMAIIGLFLPVWVDDTVSLVWWGLAAILVAGDRNGNVRK